MFQKQFDREDTPSVWCHRFPDSKSARNLIEKQPSDFILVVVGEVTLVECKSVKHLYRLPKFAQHSRMVKAAMAGVGGKILVHHWHSDTFRVILVKDLRLGAASHDLRKLCEELTWTEATERIL